MDLESKISVVQKSLSDAQRKKIKLEHERSLLETQLAQEMAALREKFSIESLEDAEAFVSRWQSELEDLLNQIETALKAIELDS